MQKTIIVCGHGPGISDAVANKFGGEGFQVALVARSADKLEQAREPSRREVLRPLRFRRTCPIRKRRRSWYNG